MQNSLITELQRGFTSVNDSFADNLSFVKAAIDDIGDNLAIYSSTNDVSSQNIITSLNGGADEVDSHRLTIAQLAEHLTVVDCRHQSVLGSIPSGETEEL